MRDLTNKLWTACGKPESLIAQPCTLRDKTIFGDSREVQGLFSESHHVIVTDTMIICLDNNNLAIIVISE